MLQGVLSGCFFMFFLRLFSSRAFFLFFLSSLPPWRKSLLLHSFKMSCVYHLKDGISMATIMLASLYSVSQSPGFRIYLPIQGPGFFSPRPSCIPPFRSRFVVPLHLFTMWWKSTGNICAEWSRICATAPWVFHSFETGDGVGCWQSKSTRILGDQVVVNFQFHGSKRCL